MYLDYDVVNHVTAECRISAATSWALQFSVNCKFLLLGDIPYFNDHMWVTCTLWQRIVDNRLQQFRVCKSYLHSHFSRQKSIVRYLNEVNLWCASGILFWFCFSSHTALTEATQSFTTYGRKLYLWIVFWFMLDYLCISFHSSLFMPVRGP